MLFLGDRRWAPNQEAYLELLTMWPDIARGIEGAELAIVGAADPNAEHRTLPDGATDYGFVDDLDAFLAQWKVRHPTHCLRTVSIHNGVPSKRAMIGRRSSVPLRVRPLARRASGSRPLSPP